jgi:hypothetical protein
MLLHLKDHQATMEQLVHHMGTTRKKEKRETHLRNSILLLHLAWGFKGTSNSFREIRVGRVRRRLHLNLGEKMRVVFDQY